MIYNPPRKKKSASSYTVTIRLYGNDYGGVYTTVDGEAQPGLETMTGAEVSTTFSVAPGASLSMEGDSCKLKSITPSSAFQISTGGIDKQNVTGTVYGDIEFVWLIDMDWG